ncbi:MAG TPA: DUF5063 domain-containing protein [Bacteroidales bacterium]|nr:DUF5063 domain-containing protein [Bacteroidales bacterium]
MTDLNDNLVYSATVLEFTTVANEYCSFVEHAASFSKRDFISKSQKLLALLYAKAAVLPEVFTESDELLEKFVQEFHYEAVRDAVAARLSTHEQFVFMISPEMRTVSEAENVSIAEAYADIYQDLKDFVMSYRQGINEVMSEALWVCKTNFEQFWGNRLLSVLNMLHAILYSGDDLDNEAPETGAKSKTKKSSNRMFDQYKENLGFEDDDDFEF